MRLATIGGRDSSESCWPTFPATAGVCDANACILGKSSPAAVAAAGQPIQSPTSLATPIRRVGRPSQGGPALLEGEIRDSPIPHESLAPDQAASDRRAPPGKADYSAKKSSKRPEKTTDNIEKATKKKKTEQELDAPGKKEKTKKTDQHAPPGKADDADKKSSKRPEKTTENIEKVTKKKKTERELDVPGKKEKTKKTDQHAAPGEADDADKTSSKRPEKTTANTEKDMETGQELDVPGEQEEMKKTDDVQQKDATRQWLEKEYIRQSGTQAGKKYLMWQSPAGERFRTRAAAEAAGFAS